MTARTIIRNISIRPFAICALTLTLPLGCVSADRLTGTIRETIAEVADDHPVRTLLSELKSSDDSVIFFLDGAGGGGLIIDWSREIHRGLQSGGFTGEFRPFVWQTGLGPIADECASVEYKREKAAQLVNLIRLVRLSRPGVKVHLMAASAGTGVAIFALESMLAAEKVESVVLLSSAMSNNYDLSDALERLRGDMHVFTSTEDAILQLVVPILGTTDRQYVDRRVAGLTGFITPDTPAAQPLYGKVKHVAWSPKWANLGHAGGHTDCKSPRFIAEIVAPLITQAE